MSARYVRIAVVCLAACRGAPPPPRVVEIPVPTMAEESPWVATLTSVRAAVESGHYTTADSILRTFERDHAGLPEAAQSAFWRVWLKADPRNPAFTPAGARAALEEYLATERSPHRAEAGAMLRLLAIADSLRTASASQRTSFEQRDRARDDELKNLRDELQRTQAELDRIKKRLAPPKP